MQENQSSKGRNWKEWFESHPFFVVLGLGTAVCVGTLAVAGYYFTHETDIAEKANALKFERVWNEFAARQKELEAQLLSIKRGAGESGYWDVSKMLVRPSEVATLGSEYVAVPGMTGCYLAEPKSDVWKRERTTQFKFEISMFGPWWGAHLTGTPGLKAIVDLPLLVWRGPEGFKIPTVTNTVYHAFPSARIRVIPKTAVSTMFEAAAATVLKDGADPDKTGHELDALQNSDLPGLFFANYVFGGYMAVSFVKGRFVVIDADKRDDIFYIRAQSRIPATAKSPLVFVDTEIVCIEREKDLVIVETLATSRDRRPPDGPWITSWLTGVRVLSD